MDLPLYDLVSNALLIPLLLHRQKLNRTHSLIYFDDLTRTDTSSVREFQARFISGQPQMHPLLDFYAVLLRSAWKHFLPSCANLVVSTSLDFVTGLIIDYDQQDKQV